MSLAFKKMDFVYTSCGYKGHVVEIVPEGSVRGWNRGAYYLIDLLPAPNGKHIKPHWFRGWELSLERFILKPSQPCDN
jgi:hypothetical protein